MLVRWGKSRLEDLRLPVVRCDLAREDREHDEEEKQENPGERLPVAADRPPKVAPAAVLDLRDGRRRSDRWRCKLVGGSD
jgi:hypothetical protein